MLSARGRRRAHGGRHADLPPPAHQYGRAAPGPGRGPALLDLLPSTHPKSCARPSLPSWPPCPAAKCPGLTNTSWSSPAGAATRQNPVAQPARRTRQPPARPSRSAPSAPARLPKTSRRPRAGRRV